MLDIDEAAMSREGPAGVIVTSIIIPTYQRPATLVGAVRSCVAQQSAELYEIIVVDNNPDGSARELVAELASTSRVPVRYVAEPRPGISHARNTGVAAAQGRYIAFLDDDQEADPGWLAHHVATLRRFSAGVSFGPIRPDFPPGIEVPSIAARRFTRHENIPSGSAIPNRSPLLGMPGTGNSVLDREHCNLGTEPFDLAYGLSGGEDTLLFRQLLQAGCRMVWCAEAGVSETIPAARLTERYLLRRAFHDGQISASTWGALCPPARGKKLFVMLAGVVQAALFSVPALGCRMCKHPGQLRYAFRVAGGLGKVFCHSNRLLPLYRSDRPDPTRKPPIGSQQLPAEP